jgi:hypothetical protein
MLSIDAQTWGILLVPNAILIAAALIRRTPAWTHAVAFSLGDLLFEIVFGYWSVFVLGQMDEKFRRAPAVAFELALMGAGVFSVLNGGLLVTSSAVGRHLFRLKSLPQGHLPISVLAGAVSAFGAQFLYAAFGRGGAFAHLAWAWMCCFAMLYVVALTKFAAWSSAEA